MPAAAAFDAFLRERRVPVRTGHPLSSGTTFRIGGPARWLVEPVVESGAFTPLAAP